MLTARHGSNFCKWVGLILGSCPQSMPSCFCSVHSNKGRKIMRKTLAPSPASWDWIQRTWPLLPASAQTFPKLRPGQHPQAQDQREPQALFLPGVPGSLTGAMVFAQCPHQRCPQNSPSTHSSVKHKRDYGRDNPISNSSGLKPVLWPLHAKGRPRPSSASQCWELLPSYVPESV